MCIYIYIYVYLYIHTHIYIHCENVLDVYTLRHFNDDALALARRLVCLHLDSRGANFLAYRQHVSMLASNELGACPLAY